MPWFKHWGSKLMPSAGQQTKKEVAKYLPGTLLISVGREIMEFGYKASAGEKILKTHLM